MKGEVIRKKVVSILICLTLLSGLSVMAFADDGGSRSVNATYTVVGSNVCMRTAPNTGATIVCLLQNGMTCRTGTDPILQKEVISNEGYTWRYVIVTTQGPTYGFGGWVVDQYLE